jgi:hypothetical protein
MNSTSIDTKRNTNSLARFVGMKWAEICWILDEEEEEKMRTKRLEINQKLDNKRKNMLMSGKYELEEGEILE